MYYWEQPWLLVSGSGWHIWGLEREVNGLKDNQFHLSHFEKVVCLL